MVVTIEQQTIKFATIDLSSSPKINPLTACNYWLLFLYRYYFLGRKQYGPYGSPWCIEQMKKIENSIRGCLKSPLLGSKTFRSP